MVDKTIKLRRRHDDVATRSMQIRSQLSPTRDLGSDWRMLTCVLTSRHGVSSSPFRLTSPRCTLCVASALELPALPMSAFFHGPLRPGADTAFITGLQWSAARPTRPPSSARAPFLHPAASHCPAHRHAAGCGPSQFKLNARSPSLTVHWKW